MGCTHSSETTDSISEYQSKANLTGLKKEHVDETPPQETHEQISATFNDEDRARTTARIDFVSAYFTIEMNAGPQGLIATPRITTEDQASLPGFEATPVILRFVDEGAANVVWSIECAGEWATVLPTHQSFLRKKLLRLRKGTKSPSFNGTQTSPPPFLSSQDVYQHYNENIQPIFSKHELVEQTLVQVSEDVIKACNAILDTSEDYGERKRKRWGWHIEHTERTGLLITSMIPNDDDSILVQLKPKWLAQSPGAPPNARRCRTCAIQTFRRTDKDHLPVCPLALVSGKQRLVHDTLSNLPKSAISALPPFMERSEVVDELTTFFLGNDHMDSGLGHEPKDYGHKLLLHLRALQQQFDPLGVLKVVRIESEDRNAELASANQVKMSDAKLRRDLGLAMTLRDCTLFIKMWKDGESERFHLDARLADLDPKSSEDGERSRRWYDAELQLVEGGWYEGTEELEEGVATHEKCMLWNSAKEAYDG
ncbi:hypothetical protein EJ08DRAFT_211422 [Tothia fuscella]|uniref:Inositol-pentakisphosphate 2-kinase n=1 Tax=Tothia fuscella TaxID=1048955 RepID=A0A9P4NSF0_9PEZI|nr:hypothetical protein EJ08DRAFT_211422 [Tothia fuscella]